MLLHVMEQLNVSKEQTVLVGDSTNATSTAGITPGIRVVAVVQDGNQAKWGLSSNWFVERGTTL